MPKPISITLRTLTPIWAGGVESSRTKRVHETGIIGSLRWWYEAILRGIGREVCNPTSDNPRERCPRNDGFYCDVCRLFGATGRSRGFRLRIGGGTSNFSGMDKIPLPSGRLHPGRKGRPGPDRPGGWFLFADARTGNLEIRIVPLFVTYEDIATLLVPLALIYRHAALGAKVANGYGVVDITGVNNEAFVISDAMLRRLPTGENAPDTLPNLRDFFFAKVRFQAPVGDPDWWQAIPGIAEAWKGMLEKNGKRVGVFDQYDRKKNDRLCKRAQGELAALRQKGLLPMAPAVRKWLRETWFPSFFRSPPPKQLGNWLFGTTRPENEASKINVSHAYRLASGEWEFRIWGWLPQVLPDGLRLPLTRQQFMHRLKESLENPSTWPIVLGPASPACRVGQWHCLSDDETDGLAYLRTLLDIAEGGES